MFIPEDGRKIAARFGELLTSLPIATMPDWKMDQHDMLRVPRQKYCLEIERINHGCARS
jgi:hypothetical protein